MTQTSAADRASIRAAEKASRRAERDRQEVLVQLMSTAPGRAWVWNHLEELHVFDTPVGIDPHQTYFLLGEQNAGKKLMAQVMQWCPDSFIQAMREANERRTIDSTRAFGQRSDGEDTGGDDSGYTDFPAEPDAGVPIN